MRSSASSRVPLSSRRRSASMPYASSNAVAFASYFKAAPLLGAGFLVPFLPLGIKNSHQREMLSIANRCFPVNTK